MYVFSTWSICEILKHLVHILFFTSHLREIRLVVMHCRCSMRRLVKASGDQKSLSKFKKVTKGGADEIQQTKCELIEIKSAH